MQVLSERPTKAEVSKTEEALCTNCSTNDTPRSTQSDPSTGKSTNTPGRREPEGQQEGQSAGEVGAPETTQQKARIQHPGSRGLGEVDAHQQDVEGHEAKDAEPHPTEPPATTRTAPR